ncbi:MAG: hypothetical protein HYV97_05190 [Bdellovibrio sp.]|nr:hypothetical protein [Bdellovibrio sp.]
MRTLSRIIVLIFVLTYVSAHAYWKDDFPTTPFETVTKEKIKDLEKQIKTLIPMCLGKLETSFGKVWKRNRHGFPKFLSVTVLSENEAQAFEGFAETHGSLFVGMLFNPYPFLSGHTDLETTVCHETVHAYFRKHMSFGTYFRLPKWAREGSAVYLVNQLSHKERRALYRQWSGERNAQLNGLEGAHSLEDYFEDALAFTFLDEKYSAVQRVLSLVLEGKDIFEAIEQASGLRKEIFLREALAYAQNYIARRLQSLNKETREAITNWSNPAARNRASIEFMRQFKSGISQAGLPKTLDFALSVAFSLDVYSITSDERELIHDYERVLKEIPSIEYGSNLANVRYKLGGLYLNIGDYNKSLHYYTLIFNENIEVPILQQSATAGILRSYVGLTDWRKVLAWSERERGLHESNVVEYRYYRGLAYQAMGKSKKARDLFEWACLSNANRRFKEKACQAFNQ